MEAVRKGDEKRRAKQTDASQHKTNAPGVAQTPAASPPACRRCRSLCRRSTSTRRLLTVRSGAPSCSVLFTQQTLACTTRSCSDAFDYDFVSQVASKIEQGKRVDLFHQKLDLLSLPLCLRVHKKQAITVVLKTQRLGRMVCAKGEGVLRVLASLLAHLSLFIRSMSSSRRQITCRCLIKE